MVFTCAVPSPVNVKLELPIRNELLVEMIYEGYLLHYGAGRVVAPAEADLGLLAGDRLYALGLARLVALGDTEAVAELADTIPLSALAEKDGRQVVWTVDRTSETVHPRPVKVGDFTADGVNV